MAMNYLKLIGQIWELRSQGIISVHEHDLYCYLLHRSCILKANPFEQSSRVACAILGIKRQALSTRRKKLEDLRLIQYSEGQDRSLLPRYQICTSKVEISKPLQVKKVDKFMKPTIQQIASYCKQRCNNIDAERFFDFYESKNWYIGRNKMKDWKAAVRTWESNDKERQSSNFTKHDNTTSYAQF